MRGQRKVLLLQSGTPGASFRRHRGFRQRAGVALTFFLSSSLRLRSTREHPPTEEEQAALAAERLRRAERVSLLKEEEARRKLRASLAGEPAGEAVGQQRLGGLD